MNHDNHDIEKIISQTSFRPLSDEEQRRVWDRVSAVQERPLPFIHFKKNYMFTSLIVALVLALGAGGTAALADNATPGDALFGVDRAVENIRLSLAGEEKKNELRIKFADERVKEIEKLSAVSPSMERPAAALVTESTVTEIEADVFTNETVIKIEYSDKKFVFTAEAKTKEAVIDEIAKAFPSLSKTFIESKLDIEIEDRGSRDEDKKVRGSTDDLSDDTKIRVTTGVAAALTLLNGVSTSVEGDAAIRLKAITDELNDYLKTLPADQTVETRIKDNDKKTRVDLRTEEGRIRVEVRDNGEIRIKTDDEDKNEGWNDDSKKNKESDDDKDDDKNDEKTPDPVVRSLEIEADIFTNETVVKVEFNDRKSIFTTDADTRAEIVAAVLAKYPTLTAVQVEAALDIESENRTSLIKDILNGGGSDDDSSDDEREEDEDHDNSGSGKEDDKDDDD